ncbi:MAG: 4Fe-4S binding protein [Candidatus Thermoplasmatota archaeon]|nr:4Fe-4S binding protein [Candidatus Thermoplasmatota archaeon]
MIHINKDWCKGCSICIDRCPQQALEESDEFTISGVHLPRLKENNTCNDCGLCSLLCPDLAISIISKHDSNR